MPVSQAHIDALTEAMATGELRVRHGDKEIQYRSVDELIKARAQLIAQQRAETGAASGPYSRLTTLMHGGRGFD